MERPYIPHYRPYGMSEEEYDHEIHLAYERLLEYEAEQSQPPTDGLRGLLEYINHILERDGIAYESELKTMWNLLSDEITKLEL